MKIGKCFVESIFRIFAAQPLKVHHKVWKPIISWIMKNILHYRRDIAIINIARSFPEKKYKEISQIADQSNDLLANMIVEAIWFSGCKPDGKRIQNERFSYITNPEVLDELYQNSPSVLILNSHRGNWETWGATYNYFTEDFKPSFSRDKLTCVYKELTSKFWNEIFEDNRCSCISKEERDLCYIESKEILRFALKHRHDKRIYMFPTDQHPYSYSTLHDVGTFMSQPTMTMAGGAHLANKFHMGVVYLNIEIESPGHYKWTFTKISDDAGEDTPERIMKEYYRLLEQDIRKEPYNYLWTHKRWK